MAEPGKPLNSPRQGAAYERPRLKDGLKTVIQAPSAPGRKTGTRYQLKDPETGKRFSFTERESRLIALADGQRDLETLHQMLTDEGVTGLTPDHILGLFRRLHIFGFLAAPAADPAPGKAGDETQEDAGKGSARRPRGAGQTASPSQTKPKPLPGERPRAVARAATATQPDSTAEAPSEPAPPAKPLDPEALTPSSVLSARKQRLADQTEAKAAEKAAEKDPENDPDRDTSRVPARAAAEPASARQTEPAAPATRQDTAQDTVQDTVQAKEPQADKTAEADQPSPAETATDAPAPVTNPVTDPVVDPVQAATEPAPGPEADAPTAEAKQVEPGPDTAPGKAPDPEPAGSAEPEPTPAPPALSASEPEAARQPVEASSAPQAASDPGPAPQTPPETAPETLPETLPGTSAGTKAVADVAETPPDETKDAAAEPAQAPNAPAQDIAEAAEKAPDTHAQPTSDPAPAKAADTGEKTGENTGENSGHGTDGDTADDSGQAAPDPVLTARSRRLEGADLTPKRRQRRFAAPEADTAEGSDPGEAPAGPRRRLAAQIARRQRARDGAGDAMATGTPQAPAAPEAPEAPGALDIVTANLPDYTPARPDRADRPERTDRPDRRVTRSDDALDDLLDDDDDDLGFGGLGGRGGAQGERLRALLAARGGGQGGGMGGGMGAGMGAGLGAGGMGGGMGAGMGAGMGGGAAAAAPDEGPARMGLFNPTALLRLLYVLFYPLKYLVWTLIPLTLIAGMTAVQNWPALLADVSVLISEYSKLTLLIGAAATINLISRLAQGVALLAHGGQVSQLGIKLALGIVPRFYVDMSSVGTLDRQGQLWAYAAPLLARLACFCVGGLLWGMTRATGSLLPEFSLIAAQLGLIIFLFTAMPFVPAEGQKWLGIYIGDPKLPQKTLASVRHTFFGKPLPPFMTPEELPRMLFIGIGTVITMTAFVFGVAVSAAIGLEAELGGTGVVLFLGLVGAFVLWLLALRAAIGRRMAQARGGGMGGGMAAMAQAGPQAHPLEEANAEQGSSGAAKVVWSMILVGLLAVAFLPYQYEAGGEVLILPTARAQAVARTEGEVIEVYVRKGDMIQPGQTIAQLSSWEQERELAITETQLTSARAALAKLEAGAKPEEIRVAEVRHEAAKQALTFSRLELERIQELAEKGTVSSSRLEEAQEQYQDDLSTLVQAEANLALVQSGATVEELAIARSEVDRLELELNYRTDELARTRIEAPMAGRVVTPDLSLRIGSFLKVGETLLEVENTAQVSAAIAVPEFDITLVEVGDPVRMKILGFVDRPFDGVVSDIAPAAEEESYGRTVRVDAVFPNPDGALRSGTSGYAKVAGEDMRVWQAYLRSIQRFFLVEFWSWIP